MKKLYCVVFKKMWRSYKALFWICSHRTESCIKWFFIPSIDKRATTSLAHTRADGESPKCESRWPTVSERIISGHSVLYTSAVNASRAGLPDRITCIEVVTGERHPRGKLACIRSGRTERFGHYLSWPSQARRLAARSRACLHCTIWMRAYEFSQIERMCARGPRRRDRVRPNYG